MGPRHLFKIRLQRNHNIYFPPPLFGGGFSLLVFQRCTYCTCSNSRRLIAGGASALCHQDHSAPIFATLGRVAKYCPDNVPMPNELFLLPWGGKSWENTEKENFLVLPRAAAISLSPTRQNNLCQDGRRRSSVRPSRGEKGVRSLLPSFFLSFSAPGLTLSSLSLSLSRPPPD